MTKRLNRNRKKDKDENRLRSRSGKSRIISPGKAVYTEGGTKRVINFGEFRRDSKGRWAEKPGSNDIDPKDGTVIGKNADSFKDGRVKPDSNVFDSLPPSLLPSDGKIGTSPQLAQRQQEYLRNRQLAFERAILEGVTNSILNEDINSENIKYFVPKEKVKEFVKNYINFAEKKMEENINSQPTVFGTSFPSCEI